MTLTLTFTTTTNGAAEISTYDREYPSLAEFITDHADDYNAAYGADNWTAVEKPQ